MTCTGILQKHLNLTGLFADAQVARAARQPIEPAKKLRKTTA